jgi:hypothetical protein
MSVNAKQRSGEILASALIAALVGLLISIVLPRQSVMSPKSPAVSISSKLPSFVTSPPPNTTASAPASQPASTTAVSQGGSVATAATTALSSKHISGRTNPKENRGELNVSIFTQGQNGSAQAQAQPQNNNSDTISTALHDTKDTSCSPSAKVNLASDVGSVLHQLPIVSAAISVPTCQS